MSTPGHPALDTGRIWDLTSLHYRDSISLIKNMTQPQQLPSRARTTTPQHPAPQAPFDANILAGQLAPSSIAMYARDFQAYVVFAGDVATACNAATAAVCGMDDHVSGDRQYERQRGQFDAIRRIADCEDNCQ